MKIKIDDKLAARIDELAARYGSSVLELVDRAVSLHVMMLDRACPKPQEATGKELTVLRNALGIAEVRPGIWSRSSRNRYSCGPTHERRPIVETLVLRGLMYRSHAETFAVTESGISTAAHGLKFRAARRSR